MMGNEMDTTKKISFWGLCAIFLVNFAYMADFVIVPAGDAIYTHFAGAPTGVLNFILTGSQGIAAISALLSGLMMRYFSKRNLMVVLFAIFTASASCSALIDSAYFMAAMRAITGFAFGAIVPIALALINEIYHDNEKKCTFLVGFFNAFMAILGSVISIVAGWLCAIQWDYVFFEYLAGIPMLIMLIIFLPKTPAEKDNETLIESKDNKVPFPYARFAALCGGTLFFCISYCFMNYQNSIYLAQTGLGNSSVSGVLTSVMTIGSMVGGFAMAVLYQKIRRGTPGVCFLALTLGYLGCCFPINVAWIGVCYFLLGFGYGTVQPYYYYYATIVLPPAKASTGLAFIGAMIGLGYFISSYVTTFVQNVFAYEQLVDMCPLYTITAGIALALSIILAIHCKKKHLDEAVKKC